MITVSLKTKQWLLLMSLLALFLVGVVGLLSVFSAPSVKYAKVASVNTGMNQLDARSVWVHQMGHALKEAEARIATLEKTLKASKKEEQEGLLKRKAPVVSPAAQLRETLKSQFPSPESETVQPIRTSTTKPFQKDPLSVESPRVPSRAPAMLTLPTPSQKKNKKPLGRGIAQLSVSRLSNTFSKTQENTLLANTLAPAVLLGSIDALTHTHAASDPKPILLQITEAGELPQGKKQSKLKGCYVSARGYGELPTERVEMRLETLTCLDAKTGAGIEMPVKGYVSGEDGRPGLRGVVVDRAGRAIQHVGMAGLFQSLAQFFVNQARVVPQPSNVPAMNWSQAEGLLKAGAGEGVGSAFEKLADFFIKRAERLEPIIQVQAGRRVTVVFTEGAPFEDHMPTGARGVSAHTRVKQAELPDHVSLMREGTG